MFFATDGGPGDEPGKGGIRWAKDVHVHLHIHSSAAGLVVAFAVTVAFCQTNRINYKFSGGDWVTGQPKPLCETFASALLADLASKITYKFANFEPQPQAYRKIVAQKFTKTSLGLRS